MTREPNLEQISEYFDGEVPSANQADVESSLSSNEDARLAMDDFGQISKMLKGLPEASAPDHIRSAVMQEIERESLLGEPPVIAAGTDPAATSRRSMWAIGSVVVSALAVVLMFQSLNRSPNSSTENLIVSDSTIEQEELRMPAAVTQPDPSGSVPRMQRSGNMADEAEGNASGSVMVADTLPAAPTDGFSAPATAAGDAMADDSPSSFAAPGSAAGAGSPGANAPAAITQLSNGFEYDLNPNSVEVGQIVKAIEHSGDEVRVVKLTVVDVFEGARSLHVLLAKNSLGRGSEKAKPQRENYESSYADANRKGELMGVFVELGEDSLSETLAELKNQGEFESLVVADSISYESFAKAQRPAAVSVAANGAAPPAGGVGGSTGRSGFRGAPPAASPAPREAIQSNGGVGGGGGFGGAASGTQVAGKNLQYIAVSEEMLRKKVAASANTQSGASVAGTVAPRSDAPKPETAPRQGFGGRGRQGQESPTAVAENADPKAQLKKSQSQKPYRVLFVLVKGPVKKGQPGSGAQESTPPPAQPSPKSPDPGAAA